MTPYIQYILPKRTLTILAGCLAEVSIPWVKNYLISRFVKAFSVDMTEALDEDPKAYPTFNAFFTRHLKPGRRPMANQAWVSPVDGTLSEFGAIIGPRLTQAKGKEYTLHGLLGLTAEAECPFLGGTFVTLYLSPKDYHRIHMPIDGLLRSTTYIPGALFSVSLETTQMIPRIFSRNERLVALFDTQVGPMAMVLIGATIVGKIGTTWQGKIKRSRNKQHIEYDTKESAIRLKQGEEMGFFELGSTVVLLFSKSAALHLHSEWTVGAPIRLGQALGPL